MEHVLAVQFIGTRAFSDSRIQILPTGQYRAGSDAVHIGAFVEVLPRRPDGDNGDEHFATVVELRANSALPI
ncbi:MAG: hypothetical protein HYZ38_14065 [Mycobacterium sp.]|nr:hypothetical protein [Mycobacterium sp.]